MLLAGLLYLGAAVGLWLHRAVASPTREAPLGRSDAWRLGLVVLSGGIAGPVLMLFGLNRVTGLAGSLLLNLEAPFTVLLAVALFRRSACASWGDRDRLGGTSDGITGQEIVTTVLRRPSSGTIGHYLAHLGARDAAALFTNASGTGA